MIIIYFIFKIIIKEIYKIYNLIINLIEEIFVKEILLKE